MNIKKGVYSLFLFIRYLYIKHFKMKKLYYLDDSEKNRILEMHNKATKNQYLLNEGSGTEQDPLTINDLQTSTDTVVNALDNYVTESSIYKVYEIFSKLSRAWALDDSNEQDKKLVNALARLSYLYSMDESGDRLLDDLQSVGTMTWSNNGIDTLTKCKNMLQQAEAVPPKPFGQGGASGKCKGWDWTKVQTKYPCTSPDMFYDTTPKCGDYGDYLEANINNKKYTFFIGDGHLYGDNNKDLGYFACKNGKLEKTSGAFMDKTNQDMTPMMESKKREFVRMITEAGWGNIGDSGDNKNDNINNNRNNSRDNSRNTGGYLSTLQNKIAEIDSSYKPTGSMDQTTINKVMSLLTQGVKPPEPTPTPYEVNQSTTSAQSED